MEKNDIEIFKIIQSLAQDLKIITFLELGGCDAYHTKLLTKLIGNNLKQYYVVEANPELWNRFKDVPVTLIKEAINDYDGTCDFWLSNSRYSGSSSIREPLEHIKVWPECTFDKKITIDCLKLDTIKSKYDIGIIDFIWSDIQGAEINAILGGEKLLSSTRYFYTETAAQEFYKGQMIKKDFLDALIIIHMQSGR